MSFRYELMTDAELRHFLAKYDLQMREAGQDGPRLRAAEYEWKKVMAEMDKRREDEHHRR